MSQHAMLHFHERVLTSIKRPPFVAYNTHSGVNFYIFQRNNITFNIKHYIFEFGEFLKVLFFVFKGSLNIPEYRRLFFGRVLQSRNLLWKISHFQRLIDLCILLSLDVLFDILYFLLCRVMYWDGLDHSLIENNHPET